MLTAARCHATDRPQVVRCSAPPQGPHARGMECTPVLTLFAPMTGSIAGPTLFRRQRRWRNLRPCHGRWWQCLLCMSWAPQWGLPGADGAPSVPYPVSSAPRDPSPRIPGFMHLVITRGMVHGKARGYLSVGQPHLEPLQARGRAAGLRRVLLGSAAVAARRPVGGQQLRPERALLRTGGILAA